MRLWAIKDAKGIDLRNAYPTQRGAMVNWLVTRVGIMAMDSWDEDLIKTVFDHQAAKYESSLIEMVVNPMDEIYDRRESIDDITDEYIRTMWNKAGGSFSEEAGVAPVGIMEYRALLKFVRHLLKCAALEGK